MFCYCFSCRFCCCYCGFCCCCCCCCCCLDLQCPSKLTNEANTNTVQTAHHTTANRVPGCRLTWLDMKEEALNYGSRESVKLANVGLRAPANSPHPPPNPRAKITHEGTIINDRESKLQNVGPQTYPSLRVDSLKTTFMFRPKFACLFVWLS